MDIADAVIPPEYGRGSPPQGGVAFVDRATAKDIYYCFRLFFGRYPNPAEWRGHAMRAGDDLRGVVRSFVNSLEWEQLGLSRGATAVTALPARFRGVTIYTHEDDATIGQAVRDGTYEPEVCALLARLLRPGMGVLDLGANIGVLSLLAAEAVGPTGIVIAVEPNPRNARLLEASRRVNKFAHLSILQVAAGRENGLLVLNTSYSNGTTSGLPAEDLALFSAETVPVFSMDAILPEGRCIDLIKVDVEGAEYLALSGCIKTIQRYRPAIITEFSPDLMPGISGVPGEVYLQWLIGQGYTLSVIETDGSLIPAGTDTAMVMRLYGERMSDHIDILAEA